MNHRRWPLLAVAVAALACFASSPPARADLPAPDGLRRVGYSFEVEGAVPPRFALLAYPLGEPSPQIEVGKSYPLVQGFRPKLYAVLREKAAEFPSSGAQGAPDAWLLATALPCSGEVPRVFTVDDASGIVSIVDRLRVTQLDDKSCRIEPVSSKYKLQSGKELEGTFREGRRVPPPELASALGDSADSGPGPAPTKRGCAGCGLTATDPSRDDAYMVVLLVVMAARRRRASGRRPPVPGQTGHPERAR